MDARHVLWDRGGRYKDHRALSFEAEQAHDWERQPVVGSIFVAGGLDGMDFTGDYLALSPGWSSEAISESLSRPFAVPKRIPLLFTPKTFAAFGASGTRLQIFMYFAKAGMFVSGSGLTSCPSSTVA
jgi:hypothetical protein